jgi:hypothetical protein
MFQSMFQILSQMRTYVSKQVYSWLLLEPNFMFLQLNQQVQKNKCTLQVHICPIWIVMSFWDVFKSMSLSVFF